jgi:phage-related protein
MDTFVKRDLKRLPLVRSALSAHLRIIELSTISTLRKTQKIEKIRGPILSYRFETRSHWVRLLLAIWPTDADILILNPLVKKRNQISRRDVALAEQRLSQLQQSS